jgi:hypothetical protein
MAPIKIEDNIREKMQEREIQPSADAWKRLEDRLGTEKKTGFNKRTWFAIAAGFIGILILASVFLNSNSVITNTELVEENVPAEMPDADNDIRPEKIIAIPDNTDNVLARKEATSEEIEENEIVTKKNEVIAKSTPSIDKTILVNEDVAVNSEIQKERDVPETGKDPLIQNDEDFIKSKINEVVAEVESRANTENAVTAEEIDALLQEAQREISNKRILNSQTQKVDAAALLLDVESELERSFRDKVFDALGDGYKKIRTAVAERNY